MMNKTSELLAILALLLNFGLIKCDEEKEICDFKDADSLFENLIPQNYLKRNMPKKPEGLKVFPVAVEIEIASLLELNQLDSTIKMQIMFSQYWTDNRLIKNCSHRSIHLFPEDRKKIWMPNLSVAGALEATLTAAPNADIHTTINHEGIIALNDMLIVKIPCYQDFSKFPFDSMSCNFMVMPTYGNDIAEICILKYVHWDKTSTAQDSALLALATHEFVGFKRGRKSFSKVEVDVGILELKRYSTFYYFQAYIPNTLTVMVAWLSFSISPSAVPARVTMGISSLIAMILQYGNLVSSIPKVGYLKGIDFWMLGCVLFIFFSMAEFAYISYLQTSSVETGEMQLNKKICKIDNTTKILYLIMFSLFVAVYFAHTLM